MAVHFSLWSMNWLNDYNNDAEEGWRGGRLADKAIYECPKCGWQSAVDLDDPVEDFECPNDGERLEYRGNSHRV